MIVHPGRAGAVDPIPGRGTWCDAPEGMGKRGEIGVDPVRLTIRVSDDQGLPLSDSNRIQWRIPGPAPRARGNRKLDHIGIGIPTGWSGRGSWCRGHRLFGVGRVFIRIR